MKIDAKTISGMGRQEMSQLLLEALLERDASKEQARLANENLTAVQKRCNELLNTDRIARFLADKPPVLACLLDLAWAIERARHLHPEGCSVLALMQEAGEAAKALERETPARFRSELIDAAAVAMRLYLGDVDPALAPRVPHAHHPGQQAPNAANKEAST